MYQEEKDNLKKVFSTFGETSVSLNQSALRLEIKGFKYDSKNILSVMEILLNKCSHYDAMDQFDVREGFLFCRLIPQKINS